MTNQRRLKQAMSSEDYRRVREEARSSVKGAAHALLAIIQVLEELADVADQLGGQSGDKLRKQAVEFRRSLPVCKETLHMLR